MKTGWCYYFDQGEIIYYRWVTQRNTHNLSVAGGVFSYFKFKAINCRVGHHSDVKHDKTYRLRYLVSVLLGQGRAAYLINLAGILLNPLSVSESWPEQRVNGQNRHGIWVFGGWSSSIEWSERFNCGISFGYIRAYSVLSSEVRVLV